MKTINLRAVGDISLQTQGSIDPFEYVNSLFYGKDILFGNLETVISNKGHFTKKAVPISSEPESCKWLQNSGFDIVNLANNHITDRGEIGLLETIKIIESVGIQYIGVQISGNNKPYSIIKKNGIKIGFLGYSTGRFPNPKKGKIHRVLISSIIKDIVSLRKQSDIIIISLHWGIENVNYPSPNQIELAHELIDAGANIVIGHHPHVLQGIEEYNGGLIAYSLGNFQFNPQLSQTQSRDSIILSIDIDSDKIHQFTIIPVIINDQYQPEIPSEVERERIISFVQYISNPIKTNKINKTWWFDKIAKIYLANNLHSYKKRIKFFGPFPLIECIFWLLTPFCVKCYISILKMHYKKNKGDIS